MSRDAHRFHQKVRAQFARAGTSSPCEELERVGMDNRQREQKVGCASINKKGTSRRGKGGPASPAEASRGGRTPSGAGRLDPLKREHRNSTFDTLAAIVREWQRTGFATKMAPRTCPPTWECGEERCCPAPLVVERDGTRVCLQCGEVASEMVFDWREHCWNDREGRLTRQAERVERGHRHLGTVIGSARWDARGKALTAKTQTKFWRLRDRNLWFGTVPLRSLGTANRVRQGILSRLGFQDPRGISARICKWVAQHKIAQGRTVDATVAAAVYVAAVEQEFPVTYAEVAAASNVPEVRLRHVVTLFLSLRPGGTADFPIYVSRARFFSPNRYIRNIGTKLGLPPSLIIDAEEIAAQVDQRSSSGHRPETKAAAAVQAACGGNIPWGELARVAFIQEPSLRKYWEAIGHLTVQFASNSRINHATHFARLQS